LLPFCPLAQLRIGTASRFQADFVFDPATAAYDVINPDETYYFSNDNYAVPQPVWMFTTLNLPSGVVQSGNDSAQFSSLMPDKLPVSYRLLNFVTEAAVGVARTGRDTWSLTHLQQRLVKTGGRLVKHARYYWLMLADSHLGRRLFGAMLQRIWALPVPAA
jgi:hypothetical protein